MEKDWIYGGSVNISQIFKNISVFIKCFIETIFLKISYQVIEKGPPAEAEGLFHHIE